MGHRRKRCPVAAGTGKGSRQRRADASIGPEKYGRLAFRDDDTSAMWRKVLDDAGDSI